MHAEALDAAAMDWAQIVGLHEVLARADPSPVVELNRAVAVAMRDGRWRVSLSSTPSWCTAIWRTIIWRTWHGRTCAGGWGRTAEARASYERALSLARQEPERRFLERRLGELQGH